MMLTGKRAKITRFGKSELGRQKWNVGFEHRSWDVGFGKSDLARRIWNVGFGTSDLERQIWNVGFETSDSERQI